MRARVCPRGHYKLWATVNCELRIVRPWIIYTHPTYNIAHTYTVYIVYMYIICAPRISHFLIHFPNWLTFLMRPSEQARKKPQQLFCPKAGWLSLSLPLFLFISLYPSLPVSLALSLSRAVSPDSFLWLQNVIKVLGANCFDTPKKGKLSCVWQANYEQRFRL